MRKIITLLLTLVIMMPVSFANAADTLYQYYYELGKKLPTISERSVIYAEIDSDFYSGTYAQNVKLLDYLQANKLGFSPTTNFTERLSSSISATDTEIPITSILDDDGIALSCSATNKCYFNIEQGTSKEERVVCSATTTTSVASCVRGLAATGNSEVGDSDRAYPHNAGSRIIMTNIAQFYGNYINLWDDQTKTGVLTFSDSPIVPSPTTATQAATKGYVDGVAQQGGATSTEAVLGLSQLATQAEMASTTFDANNPQVISTKYSTSSPGVVGHYAVITKADGDIDNDFLANDEALIRTGDTTLASTTFTGTATFNNIPVFPSPVISYTQTTSTETLGQVMTTGDPYWKVTAGDNDIQKTSAEGGTDSYSYKYGLNINSWYAVNIDNPDYATKVRGVMIYASSITMPGDVILELRKGTNSNVASSMLVASKTYNVSVTGEHILEFDTFPLIDSALNSYFFLLKVTGSTSFEESYLTASWTRDDGGEVLHRSTNQGQSWNSHGYQDDFLFYVVTEASGFIYKSKSSNFDGFIQESGTINDSVITVTSGVASVPGLTPGYFYYNNGGGTLISTPDGVKTSAGIATKEDEIFIMKNIK